MTWANVAVSFIEVLIVIGFLLTMAAVSVWADRRQSAMVQDRVGPNRAVIYLHHAVARALIAAPAFLVAAAISIPFWHRAPGLERARITTGLELAVLVGWFSLLLLCAHARRRGADNQLERAIARPDPRTYFYVGLALHLAVLPLVQLIPPAAYATDGVQWGSGLSGALAAMVIMFAGLYASSKVPDGRVGMRLAGLLHAVADAIKLIWKEDLRPAGADRLLFDLAPLLAMFPALITFAVLPFGSSLCFIDVDHSGGLSFADLGALAPMVGASGQCAAGQVSVGLQIANLNVGLLYVFAIAGTGVIGAALAGWASNNKFALLGGLRATSQMVSYEVALGLSIVPILMLAGTVDLQQLVDWQGSHTWGLFAQPFAFLLFLTAAVAETKRIPFDLPEGESEIVAGYFLEYSGMKFGLFFLGEYAEYAFSSALLVTLFFGGYQLPFLHADGLHIAFGATTLLTLKMSHLAVSVAHVVAFFGKVLLVAFLMVFIRWTLPRFRYDQLMNLGWKKLLPLALANILLTGLIIMLVDTIGARAEEIMQLCADITQGLLAVGGLLAAVALVTWLLEPPARRRLLYSSAARFVSAQGGIKAGDMQA